MLIMSYWRTAPSVLTFIWRILWHLLLMFLLLFQLMYLPFQLVTLFQLLYPGFVVHAKKFADRSIKRRLEDLVDLWVYDLLNHTVNSRRQHLGPEETSYTEYKPDFKHKQRSWPVNLNVQYATYVKFRFQTQNVSKLTSFKEQKLTILPHLQVVNKVNKMLFTSH